MAQELTANFGANSTKFSKGIQEIKAQLTELNKALEKIIIATAIIFIVGSILCALAPNIYVLILSRILVGLAVGIVNFIVPLYLSEVAPKQLRGTLVSLYQWAITAGILFSYVIFV